jgi:hypothetical protein
MDRSLELCPPVETEGGADDLNRWLGRREAFGLMAGRCSAADVECMRRIRDGKLYLSRAANWDEFCEKELHMSKSNAKHLIGLLDRFGPEYFHIAQITRISVADYRAIASAVSAEGIAWNGDLIGLNPENSGRIAEAVTALRDAAKLKNEPTVRDRVATLDGAVDRLLKQFRELRASSGRSDPYVSSSVERFKNKVERLSLEG